MDDVCAVCQETFDDDTPTAFTPCNHRLHSTCFLSAALNSDRCPVCREHLYPDEEEGLEGFDIGVDTLMSMREEVSRLAASRVSLGNLNDVIIEINEPPDLRRSRQIHAIFKACREGDVPEVRRLMSANENLATAENDASDTLLHQAVHADNDLLLRYLVNEVGVPINSTNNFRMTPLHYAVSSGVDKTTFMLNAGSFVDAQDSAGKTPLMYASMYNDPVVVKLLVDRGASTRTFDASGDTCLHHAARGNCLSVVKHLLRQTQADPKAANFLDETPLHLACATGSFTSVRFLLESGADPGCRTKSGKKASSYIPRENTRLPQLLAQHT